MGSLVYEVIERKGWREEAGARPNIEVWLKLYFSHISCMSCMSCISCISSSLIFMWLSRFSSWGSSCGWLLGSSLVPGLGQANLSPHGNNLPTGLEKLVLHIIETQNVPLSRCFGFWTGTKKPATPVFPTVAYQVTFRKSNCVLMNNPTRRLLEMMVGCNEERWTVTLKPGWFLAVLILTESSYKLPSQTQTFRLFCLNQNKPVTCGCEYLCNCSEEG